jgi:hypothetical protein
MGEKTSINRQGQSGKLELIIFDDSMDDSSYDKDIMDMMRVFMEGYNFSISFSGPGNSTLVVTDGDGNVVSAKPPAKTVLSGKLVSYSVGIMDLLDIKDGLGFRFGW